MKIVFVLSRGIHYFYYDRVVRLLHAWGHEVRIVSSADFSDAGNKSSRALIKLLDDIPSIKFENAIPRRGFGKTVDFIRGLANYAAFVRREHPTPHLAVRWVRKGLHEKVLEFIQHPFIRHLLATRAARLILSTFESLVPPDPQILAWLDEFRPQVVFSSPYIFTHDVEVEYAKASRQLGIPVIAAVLSWDNLTSKGTFHVKPDWLFVWNQNLVGEAVQIHDFDPCRVFITGAPVYDPWFDLEPSMDRASFCAGLGVDKHKPYILYLCSSKGIAEREIELIQSLIWHLSQVAEKDRPSFVVRPHPFKDMDPNGLENDWVKVFPKAGQRPDIDEVRSTYYDSLYYSAAVVGVNTTGFLESAILDKPCLTIVTPQTSRGQEMRAHFKHLMDAEYIEAAKDFSNLVERIMRIVSGADPLRGNRRKFVHDFIRPHGVTVPATRVMVGAILAVGHGETPKNWDVVTLPETEMVPTSVR